MHYIVSYKWQEWILLGYEPARRLAIRESTVIIPDHPDVWFRNMLDLYIRTMTIIRAADTNVRAARVAVVLWSSPVTQNLAQEIIALAKEADDTE